MMTRHQHRIAQVQAWADCQRQYALRIGDRPIGFDCLTEDAFQDLRDRIASDERVRRRINRDNRAVYARMRAMADRIADRSFGADAVVAQPEQVAA